MGQQNDSSFENFLDQQYFRSPESSIANAYIRSFRRGGPIDVPSYQELYGSYRDVAEREAGRQAAAINESFGSQGARYGSDLLRAHGRLRENLFQDLSLYSGDLLRNLRGQQAQEATSFAGLEFGRNEAAMNRFWQEYLRRTSPPPLFDQLGSLVGGGYGSPTTIVG